MRYLSLREIKLAIEHGMTFTPMPNAPARSFPQTRGMLAQLQRLEAWTRTKSEDEHPSRT